MQVAFIPSSWLSDANATTALYAFFGLSNVKLAHVAEEYFAPRTDFNPFAHTWSLGVEEQFYFIFPLVIGTAVLAWSKRGPAFSFALAVLLSIFSFVACFIMTSRDPVFSFYQLPTRFWELGLGLLLALSATHWNRYLQSQTGLVLNALGAAALAVLVASFAIGDETYLPFPWAVPAVVASAVIICVLFSRTPTLISQVLSVRAVVFIGLISYSLNLWHWPIYVLFRWTIGLDNISFQAFAFVLTLVVATGSYYAIEQPFRNSPVLHRLPRPATVAVMLLTVLVAAAISRIAFTFEPLLSLSVTANLDLWYSNAPADYQNGCAPKISTNKILTSGTIVLMSPSACSPQNGTRIFVAGDSHASAYTRMLNMLSFPFADPMPMWAHISPHYSGIQKPVSWISQFGVKIKVRDGFFVSLYTLPGCSFFDFHVPSRLFKRSCGEFTHATENSIKESAHPGDFLFLPSLRLARYFDQWGGQQQPQLASEADGKEAVQEAVDFIWEARNRGLKIILEGPLPLFKAPPFRCSDWFNHMNSICGRGFTISRAEIDLKRSGIMEVEATIANAVPGVSIWDPVSVLCNEGTCHAFDHGKPVFFDADHLSGYGNTVLYKSFRSHLAAALTSLH